MRVKLLVITILCVGFLNAQGEKGMSNKTIFSKKYGMSKILKEDSKGSPYLFDKWNNNTQITLQGENFTHNLFNYNIKLERFEAKISSDSIFIVSSSEIDEIKINNKEFKRLLDPDYQRNSFFEEIVSSKKATLFKKYVITVKEGNFNPMTQAMVSAPKYMVSEEYFLQTDSKEELDKVKLKKSDLLKQMNSEEKKQIASYVKENKLKYKRLEDVIKIIKYYDTLNI